MVSVGCECFEVRLEGLLALWPVDSQRRSLRFAFVSESFRVRCRTTVDHVLQNFSWVRGICLCAVSSLRSVHLCSVCRYLSKGFKCEGENAVEAG